MLHHDGMQKEEVNERMFVASLMQHTMDSKRENAASQWHVEGHQGFGAFWLRAYKALKYLYYYKGRASPANPWFYRMIYDR